jgi:hypothetical protein
MSNPKRTTKPAKKQPQNKPKPDPISAHVAADSEHVLTVVKSYSIRTDHVAAISAKSEASGRSLSGVVNDALGAYLLPGANSDHARANSPSAKWVIGGDTFTDPDKAVRRALDLAQVYREERDEAEDEAEDAAAGPDLPEGLIAWLAADADGSRAAAISRLMEDQFDAQVTTPMGTPASLQRPEDLGSFALRGPEERDITLAYKTRETQGLSCNPGDFGALSIRKDHTGGLLRVLATMRPVVEAGERFVERDGEGAPDAVDQRSGRGRR